ncbi:CPBP family intramembrane glutamic endopeptidase [Terasakiella pusilla]|uniref:CPBP family intramembrane glutamic endopeptidase n=1 Tax=Terasakiella pusilla TaxID=64973 RepID=UPI003AA8F255
MTVSRNISSLLLLSLSYIGWIKFPLEGDAVYGADYVWRLIMLVIIWQERAVLLAEPVWPALRFWFIFALFFLVMFIAHQWLYYFQFTYDLENYFYTPARYPPIKNSLLLVFDMSIGLALVAITEEFIFRYKLNDWLAEKQVGLFTRGLLTSLLFAFMHAPQGVIAIGESFLWGLFLFVVYQKTKSLHFVIVLHFITNFILFGLMALESPAWN